MTLLELFSAEDLQTLKNDKTKNTKARVKLLRNKADKRNRHKSGGKPIRDGEDSFIGYGTNTFDQSNWK